MNKRNFLKSVAALGGSALLPSSLNPLAMYKTASAAVNYEGVTVNAPSVMPQVINIFLYGGPSELSGNLTNIRDIELHSQNSYAAAFDNRILNLDDDGLATNGFVTRSGFWRGEPNNNNPHLDNGGAGGRAMQFMVDQGYMSVYRTLMKRKDGTRSHRESLLQAFKGSLDIEGSAGVGTKIAATMYKHREKYEASSLADGTTVGNIETLLLPFVSFEGETRAFQQDPDVTIPLVMRGTTLNEDFANPYERNNDNNKDKLTALVNSIRSEEYDNRYIGAANAFNLREDMEINVNRIRDVENNPLPTITEEADYQSMGLTAPGPLVYPTNSQGGGRNRYTDRVRAAVTLALVNPSSLYITVGGGLGGWDDHNNGIDNYGTRMNDLFEVMKAAMLHIKYFSDNTLNGGPRNTNDNIVINMCGDFGRRVNLNGNNGWDHGNNQNFYTLGGEGVRDGGVHGALGKVVGKTVRVGESGTNNQVTEPAPGSYEAEPMSVAATVYSYFGVQEPDILTADDELNPEGVPKIDETLPPEDDVVL